MNEQDIYRALTEALTGEDEKPPTRLSQTVVLGGWTVTVTAPEGVQHFGIEGIKLDIAEPHAAATRRISIESHLDAPTR